MPPKRVRGERDFSRHGPAVRHNVCVEIEMRRPWISVSKGASAATDWKAWSAADRSVILPRFRNDDVENTNPAAAEDRLGSPPRT